MAEADCSGEHFVEKYQADLIKRVSNIGPILDEFLHKEIIKQYSYDEIHSLPTSQKKMTALFSGPLQSSQGKAMFYKLLNKHEPYLIDELKRTDVATVAVKETLKDLSSEDLRKFKWWLQFPLLQLGLSQIPWVHLGKADTADQLVDVMVQNLGQQYVEVINEVLMDMNRTDLVQRLSETSSGLKEKHSVDEPWSALIQEQVETIESDIQRLLETLAGLSDGELQKFKDVLLSEMYFRCPSDYLLMTFEVPDKQNLVLFIVLSLVLIYGHMSVNKTMWILMEMNRIDLVHRLSRSSSGPKEKLSDEHRSTLIKKVATKSAVKLHLLETMKEFDYSEFGIFVEFLQWIVLQKNLPVISLMLRRTEDKAGTVDLMMQTYGYQSVDLTREVVYRMSSEFKASAPTLREPCVDEQQPALPEREAAMASVKKELLKTLKYLSNRELEKYKMLLLDTERKKGLPRISRRRLKTADRYEIVKLMMEIYDQQSVEVNKEVLMEMDKRDLVERSETRFRTEKRPSKPIQKEATMASVKKELLKTLIDLSNMEFEKYKMLLQYTQRTKGLPRISRKRLKTADRYEIVELMMEIYDQQSVEVTKEVLMEMERRVLVQRFSDFSLGSRRPSRSLDHEDCGSIMVSSDWTELEPEVNIKDADEAPTYSLQSEAGTFECSVSGLRWICKGKVSFKYQFCPLEEHMERINSLQYMPAGPLMDITVTAGKLDEVHLPHWICIDDNPTILDKFAVLHIDDCGEVVEKVSEVTSSHVKLCEPVFSPRAVLMRVGFPVKINCNVLIYKTNTAFLTLHVYLIPRDPGLQQVLDKRELSLESKEIRKPNPEKSLKMKDCFVLTTDLDGAEICPETLMLRYENPNFFEVFIDNPHTNFKLKLTNENERQPVWTCTLRRGEYQSTVHVQGEHFVDEHRTELINRVSNIASIMDMLLKEQVISQAIYDEILDIPNKRDKMRNLYSGPLNAAGSAGKDVFYKLLEENEKYLMDDLKEKK